MQYHRGPRELVRPLLPRVVRVRRHPHRLDEQHRPRALRGDRSLTARAPYRQPPHSSLDAAPFDKAFGARPFVDAARIIALAHGIPHSSTTARLRAAAAQMKLGNDDVNAVIDGFFFIQTLRLRNQRGDTQPGAANRVDPDKLNELDRQVLKEAFKQAKRLQLRLQLEYRL